MKYQKTKIIAEIGVNHNGNLSILKKYFSELSKLDIDFIKLQLYKSEYLVTPDSKSATYARKINSKQIDMLKKYELNKQHLNYLMKNKNKFYPKIKILFTPFEEESFKYLVSNKFKIIKIASSDLTTYPYLKEISNYKLKIILSTGMSNHKEIKEAIKILTSKNKIKENDIALLYCVSAYPTSLEEINLNNLVLLKRKFKNHPIGLSDHTISNLTGALALNYNARYIEKHVTLDKSMIGPDHKSRLNINEFRDYVNNIREAEKILFSNSKSTEMKNKKLVRKYLVAKTKILKNENFTKKNLTYMRCSFGKVESKFFDDYLKKTSKRSYEKYESIE